MSDPWSRFEFSITGEALKSILKRLRPAFPRRGKMNDYKAFAKIMARPDRVAFALPGAKVGAAAVCADSFDVEIPFSELAWISKEDFGGKELLRFAFSPEHMTFRALTIQNPRIHVGEIVETEALATGALGDPPGQTLEDPLDSPMGLPLLGIYSTLKKWPPDTFHGNRRIQEGQQEIEQILQKADKLLQPLGLGRDDLTALIEKRLGLAPCAPAPVGKQR